MLQRQLSEENAQESVPIPAPIHAPISENKIDLPSDEEIEEFQEWLDYVSENSRKGWDGSSLLIVGLAFLPLGWQIYNWWQFQPPAGTIIHINWTWIILYSVLATCLPLELLAMVRHIQAETQGDLQLGALETRWVGPLTDALLARKPRTRSLAARALARLLPRLKASDGALLDERQRRLLLFRLRDRSTDLTLKLAILKAFERIGDEKVVEFIEPLVGGPAWLPGRRRLRKAALAVLEKYLEPAASSLTTQLGQEARTADENQRLHAEEPQRKFEQPALRILFLIAAWATILPISLWQSVASAMNRQWGEAGLWAVPFLLATQLPRYLLLPRHTEAVQKIAARQDMTKIGELVDALDMPDEIAQKTAKTALTELLPRMRASDAGLLNATQRNSLYRRLKMSNAVRDAPFLEAVLKALEQVGDELAAPYVDRLANGIALTPSQKRVKVAAQECQPYLKDRSAQIKASQTLLRASSIDEDRTASLLRPTGEAVVADPQELLRAASESDTT